MGRVFSRKLTFTKVLSHDAGIEYADLKLSMEKYDVWSEVVQGLIPTPFAVDG